MWFVAKIKNNQEKVFIKDFSEKLKKNILVYYPKILTYQSKKEKSKNILGNYIFCHNKDISNNTAISKFCFLKGLQYFIFGSIKDSNQINEFVTFCKKNENSQGYLSNQFFFNTIKTNAEFFSGPLKNIMLNILNIKKKTIFAEIGRLKISIKKNSNKYCCL